MSGRATSYVNTAIDWFYEDLPKQYHGQTIVAILDPVEPMAFWVPDADACKAFYCTDNTHCRVYDCNSPDHVINLIMSSITKGAKTYRYFVIDEDALEMSLEDHYDMCTDLKSRLSRKNFKIKGTTIMEPEDEDDALLSALEVDEDEADTAPRAPAVPLPANEDQSKLPPHRRSNPPSALRDPKDYAKSLKGS